MTAIRSNTSGSSLNLHWDTSTCAATNYHLLYGPLAGVPSYAIAGAACGLGPGGNYDWTGVPAENLWFTVVGDNGSGTESSWGKSSSGAERGGTTPSGQCGITARNNSASCP
jgi:hypothetical protein